MEFTSPISGGAAVSPDSLVYHDTIRKIAVNSEKLGFDSIWANEHATRPTDQTPVETVFYEPLTLLSSLSSVTSRITIGTAIIILPFRDPFVLAKEASTLFDLSGGRLVLGVGPGRFEREYKAQSKNWLQRNKILNEQINLIKELTSGSSVNFAGKYYSSADFSIRPSAREMPIVLGGSGPIAIKRAAKLCDGIMPGHITSDDAKVINDSIQRELVEFGLVGKKFTLYNEIILSIGKTEGEARSKFSNSAYVKKVPYATELSVKALIGRPDQVVEKIRQYSKAGVQEFILIFADETEPEFLESMELFSSQVIDQI